MLSWNITLILRSPCSSVRIWSVVLFSYLHWVLQFPWCNLQIPAIYHDQSLKMPKLSPLMQSSMKFIAQHGIGAILVFEYLYFLLQGKGRKGDLQENLTLAVKHYQTSAFQEHGENVEVLCSIFLDIAKKNQISKILSSKG
ncbi:hypothetical protein F5J12DRAFT_475985 [Pisolithus orientalis]|uniref:uncharacterized protein n=1 Tax=Pisolithus orientalis TaxID=936130 RepID=UPI002224315F|nr:uncharacterized protein F5J12DRAFT_475985 [Pisolithus orientalis]KAI5990567.1 hypothetical protein F5J12DRAFT_475985 [Pisolithus orientalis]